MKTGRMENIKKKFTIKKDKKKKEEEEEGNANNKGTKIKKIIYIIYTNIERMHSSLCCAVTF